MSNLKNPIKVVDGNKEILEWNKKSGHVLARFNGREYVVWSCDEKCENFFWGHYFGDNYENAMEYYNNKIGG